MNEESGVFMGVLLLAATVAFLTVAPSARSAGTGASGSSEVPWGLVIALGIFGFVGRHWLLARRTRKRSQRSWSRRRRALPPAPEPRDREPGA